jgi:hypothetical protein
MTTEESDIIIAMNAAGNRDGKKDAEWRSDREVALRVLTAVVHQVLPWTFVVPETKTRLLDHHISKDIMMQMVRFSGVLPQFLR